MAYARRPRIDRKSQEEQVYQQNQIYLQEPRKYLSEVLGIKQLWKLQEDLVDACPKAIRDRKHIYIASGHSLGKDYISAAMALWFLQTHWPSIVILTAPGDRQMRQITWKETRRHWDNKLVNLGGRAYIEPRIEISQDWYLTGFATKETGPTKEGGGGRFQGFHEQNCCIIVTEAQAVEDEIYDQIDAITTTKNCLVIFIGNPTRSKGRFAGGLRDKVHNIVFHFSCLENPNYLGRKEIIPGLAAYEWVEKQRERWGESDPRWISRVLGQIPDFELNQVFPLSLIDHMRSRQGFLAPYSDNRGVALDPAGEGADENVFMAGSGGEVTEKFTRTIMSPVETALKAVDMCRKIRGHFIVIDCDGVGIGHYQEACRLPDGYRQGINIVKFHGSGKCTEKDGLDAVYKNLRTEAAFIAKDRGRAGIAAVDESDRELIEELLLDEFYDKTPLQIIEKDLIRKALGGRSPGSADCWKMLQWAFHQNYRPIGQYQEPNARLPRYAPQDDPLQQPQGQPKGLPAYAPTD